MSTPEEGNATAPARSRGRLARAAGPLLVAGVVVLGFASGLLISRWQDARVGPTQASAQVPGFLWPDPRAVADFSLADHHGARFDRARLDGKWSLLFFGYTHCPDVCPVTLSVLKGMRDALAASGARVDDVQTVMVSVDPARDDPNHLGQYVTYFDPSFLGVTGTPDALQGFTRDLGIIYFANPPDENGDYLVDHSASVLLTDPQGRLVGVFSPPHEPEGMAKRFTQMRAVVEGQVAATGTPPPPAPAGVTIQARGEKS